MILSRASIYRLGFSTLSRAYIARECSLLTWMQQSPGIATCSNLAKVGLRVASLAVECVLTSRDYCARAVDSTCDSVDKIGNLDISSGKDCVTGTG